MLKKGMFRKPNYIKVSDNRQNSYQEPEKQQKVHVPEGSWSRCLQCGELLYVDELARNHYVCYKCGKYMRMGAQDRIRMIMDRYTFQEWDTGLDTPDPLSYEGYKKKIGKLQEKTGLDEAVITGAGCIHGERVVIAVCDSRFMMGSMGYVAGEKITRAVERATKHRLPIVIFTCSGGARMQEGMVSLMQMAKTAQAIKKHSDAGLFYLTVLTDPTTGGVTASFAMLGDIILGEPGALVGFAGPRVIEQTIKEKLPEGFQTTEFLVKHGIIDGIAERSNLKETIFSLLRLNRGNREHTQDIGRIRKIAHDRGTRCSGSLCPEHDTASDISPWEKVKLARSQKRLMALDYIHALFKDFMELHGERQFGDDRAVVGGIASFHGIPVTVIGQQKGKNTKENIMHNFGMPYPEGYRKALRLMKQAEKFNRPIICFVDTPGAFCGIGAEERGQGEAIAHNLLEMSSLKVPVLSVMIGEGGSGGALALAVANEVWMMENAMYSILSPEGFASILWKDSSKAEQAAKVMRVTAADLYEMGIVDEIIPEKRAAQEDMLEEIASCLDERISSFLYRYSSMDGDAIALHRYKRFRNM